MKIGILILVIVKIIVSLTNNVVNRSIGVNRVNISNFLNNECVNIYVMWYRLYNFLLGGKDILFKNQIISCDYSKNATLGAICGSLYRNYASSKYSARVTIPKV